MGVFFRRKVLYSVTEPVQAKVSDDFFESKGRKDPDNGGESPGVLEFFFEVRYFHNRVWRSGVEDSKYADIIHLAAGQGQHPRLELHLVESDSIVVPDSIIVR